MQEVSEVEARGVPCHLSVGPVSFDAIRVEGAAIVERNTPRFAVGIQVCGRVVLCFARTTTPAAPTTTTFGQYCSYAATARRSRGMAVGCYSP